MNKYRIQKSRRLAHERYTKETFIEMTMRDLMTEVGSYVMCGHTVLNASIDHVSLVENLSAEDPASPLYTRFDVLEEIRA